jgi:hypothetical protein
LLTLPPGAGAMIGVALGFGVAFVSLMFLVAYFLQSPQLTAVAREELAALIFTVFILFFWLGMDVVLNDITIGLALSVLPSGIQGVAQSTSRMGLSSGHIQLAIASLSVLEEKLLDQYKDLYLFEMLIGFLSTISFPIASPFVGVSILSFSFMPFTGLVLLSNAHTTVVEAIGYLVTALWAKEFILLFARDVVPLLILPLGLVLRAIPFFRKTGSSIIAVAFTLYYVFPLAVLFSNYLIFDVYKAADFTYTPTAAGSFKTPMDQSAWQRLLDAVSKPGGQGENILSQFNSPDIVNSGLKDPASECFGNAVVQSYCSFKNMAKGAGKAIAGFAKTMWGVWKFMVGMSGDFAMTMINNPLTPASSSSGLFYFIIKEVLGASPYVILTTITTVIEIIFTITMYRNVSVLLGGEAELIGVTKVI